MATEASQPPRVDAVSEARGFTMSGSTRDAITFVRRDIRGLKIRASLRGTNAFLEFQHAPRKWQIISYGLGPDDLDRLLRALLEQRDRGADLSDCLRNLRQGDLGHCFPPHAFDGLG